MASGISDVPPGLVEAPNTVMEVLWPVKQARESVLTKLMYTLHWFITLTTILRKIHKLNVLYMFKLDMVALLMTDPPPINSTTLSEKKKKKKCDT